MRGLHGIGAGTGVVIGPARLFTPRVSVEGPRSLLETDVGAEVHRFDAAIAVADAEIRCIGGSAQGTPDVGQEIAEVHRLILSSTEFSGDARRLIRNRLIGAEWAVALVIEELRRLFENIRDERFRARFADVEAVSDRLLRALTDAPPIPVDETFAGVVVIGAELWPLDVIALHRIGTAGLVTQRGGPSSHTAILARTLGLPYACGVEGLMSCANDSDLVCVDGTSGEVVIRPDAATVRRFEARRTRESERRSATEKMRSEPSVTTDGTHVALGANVESPAEVATAVRAGADHIGLVRTELLYLGRADYPSEDEQYADAVAILEAAEGRRVTFRTLDVAEDKLPGGVHLEMVPNPALGMRGIRFSLRNLELFRTQLRALYRAASRGPLQIMLPLVSSVEEVRAARTVCREVVRELAAANVPHDAQTPLGAMIETPGAALCTDHIAAECDFLSVGTNDLIQYAFAADRQNSDIAFMYQPLHPAVLRMLEIIFTTARNVGCPVAVCGDMAGDPRCAGILLGLGLRAFSMPACALPYVKATVRSIDLAKAVAAVAEARAVTSHADVLACARSHLPEPL